MIELTSYDGKAILIAPSAIADVHEAGVGAQYHGICSFIKTFDGRTLEVRDTVKQIAAAFDKLKAP